MPKPLNKDEVRAFATLELSMVDGSQSVNTLLLRSWNGSPFNVDAFRLQAFGTGEGGQAHGWGLYFAKGRETAARYREELSSNAVTSLLG